MAGRSLRAGLATLAAPAGVDERAIMAQTGHCSMATLRRYIREGSLFLENAAAKVGLLGRGKDVLVRCEVPWRSAGMTTRWHRHESEQGGGLRRPP